MGKAFKRVVGIAGGSSDEGWKIRRNKSIVALAPISSAHPEEDQTRMGSGEQSASCLRMSCFQRSAFFWSERGSDQLN